MPLFNGRRHILLSLLILMAALLSFKQVSENEQSAYAACSFVFNQADGDCICKGDNGICLADQLMPHYERLASTHFHWVNKAKRLHENSFRALTSFRKAVHDYYLQVQPLSLYKVPYFLSEQHAFIFRLTFF